MRALSLCILLLAATAFAADEPQIPTPKPGKEHAVLKKDVGVWDTVAKVYFGAEPVTYKGIEVNRLICDGLWLQSDFDTEFATKRFKGHGFSGWDPVKKKYVGSWVDNFSDNVSQMEGEYDAKSKTFTMMVTSRDAESGKMVTARHTTVYKEDGSKVFTIFHPIGDGKYHKLMEMTSTRRKARPKKTAR